MPRLLTLHLHTRVALVVSTWRIAAHERKLGEWKWDFGSESVRTLVGPAGVITVLVPISSLSPLGVRLLVALAAVALSLTLLSPVVLSESTRIPDGEREEQRNHVRGHRHRR